MDNTRNYRWVIVHDFIAEPDAAPGTYDNAVGISGPRGCPEILDGPAELFRMKDDDDNVYYMGLLYDPKHETSGFEPLDQFGRPNAGAVHIEYWTKNNRWELR